MQPDQIGQHGDHDRGVNHRGIAEQALAAEGGGDFGKNAERRQDQDVYLRVTPDPDQVDVHHRVTTKRGGKEVRAGVAIERKQHQHRGQHREGGNDQHVGAQRGPHEHWHLHQAHAGRTHLDDGDQQVDARQQGSDTGNLQGPDVVVHSHVGTRRNARQRRVGQPAGARELADEQRHHHQHGSGRGHPEAEVVEERKRHVARADLQRNDEVHDAGDQRHRYEENHDHAVRGKHLVIVFRRQKAVVGPERHRLLRAHHDGIGKAAQQHHQTKDDVHDADFLVVDAGEPFVPQIAPQAVVGDDSHQRQATQHDGDHGAQHDRHVQRQRLPRQPTENQFYGIEVIKHLLHQNLKHRNKGRSMDKRAIKERGRRSSPRAANRRRRGRVFRIAGGHMHAGHVHAGHGAIAGGRLAMQRSGMFTSRAVGWLTHHVVGA